MKNESANRETVRINTSVKVEDGMEFFPINIYGINDDHYSAWWPSKQKIDCGNFCYHVERNPVWAPGALLPLFCSVLRLCTTSSPLQTLRLQPGKRLGCMGWAALNAGAPAGSREWTASAHTKFLFLVVHILVSLLSPIKDFLRHTGTGYLWDLKIKILI